MDLNEAIAKHTEWKMKLRSAISKKETIDAVSLRKDNCCELGKWLHGEARGMFGRAQAYTECLSKHAVFHAEAGKVATAINLKKYDEAQAMLGVGTPYTAASNAVGVAVIRLKQELVRA